MEHATPQLVASWDPRTPGRREGSVRCQRRYVRRRPTPVPAHVGNRPHGIAILGNTAISLRAWPAGPESPQGHDIALPTAHARSGAWPPLERLRQSHASAPHARRCRQARSSGHRPTRRPIMGPAQRVGFRRTSRATRTESSAPLRIRLTDMAVLLQVARDSRIGT